MTRPAASSPSMTPALWAMMIVLSLLWGGSFFFNGVVVMELPLLTIVFFRVFLAALGLHLFLVATGNRLRANRQVWIAFAMMGLLNNAIPFSLIVYGQTQIASGVASILNATTPLFTLVVAHLFTADEKIGAWKAAGIAAGFAGVAVMLGGFGSGSVAIAAYAACLGAALSYGFAGVWGRRFKALGVAPSHVAAGQLTASSAMLLPLMLIADQPWTLSMPGTATIASLVALAIASTALAYILFFRILSGAGATNISLVTFLIPPSAIMLGIAFLGETLETRHIIGMVLIGLGLALVDGRFVAKRRSKVT